MLKPSKPPNVGRLDVRLLTPVGDTPLDTSLGPKMALKPENLALQ